MGRSRLPSLPLNSYSLLTSRKFLIIRMERENTEMNPNLRKKTKQVMAAPEQLQKAAGSSREAAPEISDERYKQFMKLLYALIVAKNQAQSLEMDMIAEYMRTHETRQPFTQSEIEAIIEKMQDDNKVMRSGDTVLII